MRSEVGEKRSQRGSAVVEAALLLLPFFVLVCGVIDSSMVIFLKNTVRHATREGVRYAVTGQLQSGMCQDDSIKSVVQQSAAGFLAGTEGLSRIQVSYYNPETFAAAENRPGNIVEVAVVGLPWSWIVPIGHDQTSMGISASSSDLLEAAPNGVVPCR